MPFIETDGARVHAASQIRNLREEALTRIQQAQDCLTRIRLVELQVMTSNPDSFTTEDHAEVDAMVGDLQATLAVVGATAAPAKMKPPEPEPVIDAAAEVLPTDVAPTR
jgi:hypothetical protein